MCASRSDSDEFEDQYAELFVDAQSGDGADDSDSDEEHQEENDDDDSDDSDEEDDDDGDETAGDLFEEEDFHGASPRLLDTRRLGRG